MKLTSHKILNLKPSVKVYHKLIINVLMSKANLQATSTNDTMIALDQVQKSSEMQTQFSNLFDSVKSLINSKITLRLIPESKVCYN